MAAYELSSNLCSWKEGGHGVERESVVGVTQEHYETRPMLGARRPAKPVYWSQELGALGVQCVVRDTSIIPLSLSFDKSSARGTAETADFWSLLRAATHHFDSYFSQA